METDSSKQKVLKTFDQRSDDAHQEEKKMGTFEILQRLYDVSEQDENVDLRNAAHDVFPLFNLPIELVYEILSYLSPPMLKRLEQLSQSWKKFLCDSLEDEKLWRISVLCHLGGSIRNRNHSPSPSSAGGNLKLAWKEFG